MIACDYVAGVSYDNARAGACENAGVALLHRDVYADSRVHASIDDGIFVCVGVRVVRRIQVFGWEAAVSGGTRQQISAVARGLNGIELRLRVVLSLNIQRHIPYELYPCEYSDNNQSGYHYTCDRCTERHSDSGILIHDPSPLQILR